MCKNNKKCTNARKKYLILRVAKSNSLLYTEIGIELFDRRVNYTMQGGKRINAGRTALPEDVKKIGYKVYLSPILKQEIERYGRGENFSQKIGFIIEQGIHSVLVPHTYNSIDLFAGIGGIRKGFDNAFGKSIQTVFVSEWDKYAQETYKANFKDSFEINGDITKIDGKDIPQFDICLAGFPCQAFSLAGQRKGFADDYKGMSRGTLFFDVARICEMHKPKVIFCENVKGLTIHDKGRTFKIITKTLESLGYNVFFKILNSKDFGVPQNRERIYIVAFRNDIESSSFEFPKSVDDTKKIKDILEENPVSAKYYLSDTYIETLKRHKARHAAMGHGFGYEIRSLDSIAGAIVCGGMGRERNLIVDDRQKNLTPVTHIKGKVNTKGIRKMTPREWARLQGFPDDYVLPLADTHMYKQFGNSVTVNVIEAIAKNIKKVLDKN